MKKFVRFYYRCSFKVCLCVFLSLIGLIVLSSSVFAAQYGDYVYSVSNGTVAITDYIGAGGDVVIPSTINGMPVVAIWYYIDYFEGGYYGAFEDCTRVTSVTIPSSVTRIGQKAFFNCSGLTSVTIPNSVTSIENYAFYNCTSLTSVTIPASVTSIGGDAFLNCTSLTSIVVDASNTLYSSQDGVLYNKAKTLLIQYPGGKSGGFTIPNSVTSIGVSAFEGCSGLTSVTIPNSVTSIGVAAFEGCSGLTSVTIPNSVTTIYGSAFYNCTGLTKAYFYGNAPSIGAYVFSGCASNFSICYTAGSTGFTTPMWNGYPASVCGETTSSTTTSIVTSSTTTTTPPTVISLIDFNALPGNRIVNLTWSTASEIDNAGFNLYRSETEDGEYTKINDALIQAEGSSTQGASYEYTDTGLRNGKTYYYKLEDIDLNGTSTMHGPLSATPRLIYGIGK